MSENTKFYAGRMTTADMSIYVNAATGNDTNTGADSSHALGTIQAAVKRIPQFVNHAVWIYIADGTYTGAVILSGYSGTGSITMKGTDTTLGTTVKTLQVQCKNSSLPIFLMGLTATSNAQGFYIYGCNNINISNCSTSSSTLGAGDGVLCLVGTRGIITNCNLSNKTTGINAGSGSDITSQDNIGTGNTYGIGAMGGTIRKIGTQPIGTTMEYLSPTSGGLILNSDGSSSNTGVASCTTSTIIYYVDTTNGLDTNLGTSAGTGNALKTITAALAKIPLVLNHNITINLAAGTYNEDVSINSHSGIGTLKLAGGTDITTAANFSISSVTIVSCTCPITVTGVTLTSTTKHGITGSLSTWLAFSYVRCIGTAATYACIYLGGGSTATISNCLLSNHGQGLTADNVSGIYSVTNSGTGNTIGLYACGASRIGMNGSQPAGTTATSAVYGSTIS